MSLLATVLTSLNEVEMDQIKERVPQISKDVEELKNEVSLYLESVYANFMKKPNEHKDIAKKLTRLNEELKHIQNNIENVTKQNIQKAEDQIKEYGKRFEENIVAFKILSDLMNIHNHLIEIKQLKDKQLYLECMEKINETEDCSKTFDQNEAIPALSQLLSQVYDRKLIFIEHITEIFNNQVILNNTEDCCIFKVRNDTTEMLQSILKALHKNSESVSVLDKLTKKMWEQVFVPVVDFKVSIDITTDDNFNIMKILYLDRKQSFFYYEVYSNIQLVLNFLSENINWILNNNLNVLSYIGKHIGQNLSELIIKHCLQKTVPTKKCDLDKYNVVIEATEQLQKCLIDAFIFDENTMPILNYAKNIDTLFMDKQCQEYKLKAQILMKKDLHNIVEIGVDYDPMKLENLEDYPKSSVSKSVIELLQLIEIILEEVLVSSDVFASRLLYIASNIVYDYGQIVPNYHKKLLQTIPQQIAIFYNNCHYLSHEVSKLNSKYLLRLTPIIRTEFDGFSTDMLEKIGSELFLTFVDNQIKQINETMKETELQTKQTLVELDPIMEKCLRQCLRQQELLKTVWIKVLPYNVYNKNIGLMLNELAVFIINVIVKFEDISAMATNQLVELLNIVTSRGPKLFADPNEVTLFVNSWYKLNELIFVLNGNLLDINDRYANGNGPLALQFTAMELRQLVRALFQNTERRDILLSKIHH